MNFLKGLGIFIIINVLALMAYLVGYNRSIKKRNKEEEHHEEK